MKDQRALLERAVDSLLDTMPPVWERTRANLRAAATEEFGITLDQFHTLRHIRRGCRSAGELAERRQVSRPAVSQTVEALVAKGLVTRSPSSGDRRCHLLELTPYAREALEANYEANRSWMKSMMSGLSPAELDCVSEAMEVLKRTFAPALLPGKEG